MDDLPVPACHSADTVYNRQQPLLPAHLLSMDDNAVASQVHKLQDVLQDRGDAVSRPLQHDCGVGPFRWLWRDGVR